MTTNPDRSKCSNQRAATSSAVAGDRRRDRRAWKEDSPAPWKELGPGTRAGRWRDREPWAGAFFRSFFRTTRNVRRAPVQVEHAHAGWIGRLARQKWTAGTPFARLPPASSRHVIEGWRREEVETPAPKLGGSDVPPHRTSGPLSSQPRARPGRARLGNERCRSAPMTSGCVGRCTPPNCGRSQTDEKAARRLAQHRVFRARRSVAKLLRKEVLLVALPAAEDVPPQAGTCPSKGVFPSTIPTQPAH
jgi:hypothetical protein